MWKQIACFGFAVVFLATTSPFAGSEAAAAEMADEFAVAPPPPPAGTGGEVADSKPAEDAYQPVAPAPAPAKAPPQPWKGLFYDNDFSYKRDPNHEPLWGEELKDVPLDFLGGLDALDNSTLSFGGELRYRFMSEDNRLRPGGPAQNTYDLWRWRNYIDFRASDVFRAYVEMIDASIFNEDMPALTIDLNRWNIQNAFIDIKTIERDGKPVYFRAGRQELLYGAQRLVSPLDWSNTRRNFEGLKLTSKGETWDVDVFTTRPVNLATGREEPLSRFDNEHDRAGGSRTFNGVYATYHGMENHAVDFYWLWLREQEERADRKDGSRHTVGYRWLWTHKVYDECCDVSQLWKLECEAAYQFGHDNNLTVNAAFCTADLSVTLPQVPWQPTFKALHYWGSGDRNPNDGQDNTFCVLFPLGHAYWGFIDNLSGQNLNDYSLQFSVKPTEKLTFLTAMHWFELANDHDVVYNVAGAPLGAPQTGVEIGEELDLWLTYAFNPNLSVNVGYFWFWNGTFIQNNLPRPTQTELAIQTTLRY